MNTNASIVLIVNSCILGFVILMTANTLKGTGAYQQIQLILGGGAAMSLLTVGAGMVQKEKDQ